MKALSVKSPSVLMLICTLSSAAAIEEKENGCRMRANGERPTVIHPNRPGSNLKPS